ncbi:DNA polymerase/3'-5' exonuclease PolX [Paraconexibacter algicola]|uniref:DNA-directed DNA polymerase n=1 Tax=Paraconexibacter algicola TaxID=2133960 RepID=A0A2T4UJH3_9ACTN|nr:DNA polymerase/3'-5' exonuclease PolX [Paraconexibacter algicola]PTL59379.1 DNA polymerase/3'-5' exonuclease PolX [Paraconexibacter algicola]
MPDPTNAEIAALLDELGDLYELDGAIIHRVTAYRNAAKAVRDATTSIAARVRAGTVTEIPGIGKTLEEKLVALVETGEIPATVKLRAKFPAGLVQMTRLPGLGPKRARKLFDELGIDSLDALRTAAESQSLRAVKGFGPKFEATVLAALDAGAGEAPRGRVPLHDALAIAEPVLAALREHPASERVELAGSARRWVDSVKDLDIIATASDPAALAQAFAELDLLESAGGIGDAGARGRTHSGLSIDLKIVAPAQFGNLLQHFTGSKQHNVALREAAVKRGLHVSEYGVTDDATGETHHCETEAEVYALLGLPYIEPELRENRGELARDFVAPTLVTVEDLRGDLHSHTTASDGHGTIREMAQAALALGHEYLAVTDHSASHGFGNDVSPKELVAHMAAVRRVSDELDGITLLAGSEVNILTDGTLDYEDDLLAQLDWVVASVHTSFAMTAQEMTDRIVRAIEHPLVDAIGHPTGRLIEQRAAYALDMDAIIEAAARTGTFLEINGSPRRRDLHDVHARAAVDAGVKLIISSDAHRTTTLDNKRWGVATARRAGLGPDAIANTLPLDELLALRAGRR